MDPLNTQIETPKKNSPVLYFVIGFVMLLVGLAAGIFADPYLPAAFSNSKKGYETGFTAAKTLVEKSSLGSILHQAGDMRLLSGKVTALQGNRLSIENTSENFNPFEPVIKNRTVIVDANTKITKLNINNIPTGMHASSSEPYVQTAADLSTIAVGDQLVISTKENVAALAEFTAQEIQILPKK